MELVHSWLHNSPTKGKRLDFLSSFQSAKQPVSVADSCT